MELVDKNLPKFAASPMRRVPNPTATRLRATEGGRFLEEQETGCRIAGAELQRMAAGWEAEFRAELDEADALLRERKAAMASAVVLAGCEAWRDWHVARISELRTWVKRQLAKLAVAKGPKSRDTLDWAKARAYPITSLVEVDRAGFARCVAHREKTGSMKVYADNHAHCFSCSFHGSAIDVAAALWNVAPAEAAKRLSN